MIEQLIEKIKSYNPQSDIKAIERVFLFAKEGHKDQKRNSGEPYIIHPFQVALILADLNMDDATIMAGLMHDILEDTECSFDQMKELFGEEVTRLVDGVTKLKNLKYKTK